MILSPTKFHLPNTSQRIFRKSFVLRLVVHVGKEIHIPETDLFSRNLVYNNTVCRRVQNYSSWMQYWLLPFFKNVYPTSMPSETLVNPLFLNQSTFSASSVWFLNSSHSEPSEHHHHAWHNITQIQIRLLSQDYRVLNHRSRNYCCSYQNWNIFQKCFWKDWSLY